MTRGILLYLFNSIWQIPLLALIAYGLSKLLRNASAQVLHRMWVGYLLLTLVTPAFSVSSVFIPKTKSQRTEHNGNALNVLSVQKTFLVPRIGQLRVGFDPFETLSLLYLSCVGVGILRIAAKIWRVGQIASDAIPIENWEPLLSGAPAVHADLLMHRVRIFQYSGLVSPAVIEWPRPMLLIPDYFKDLSTEELEASLWHEMAHIRRHDFILNLLYDSLAVFSFYHPIWHWLKRELNLSREMVCDEIAAKEFGDARRYARSLLRLAELTQTRRRYDGLALGLFTSTKLEVRIMRLLEMQQPLSRLRIRVQSILLATCFLASSLFATSFAVQPMGAQSLLSRPSQIGENHAYPVVEIAHGDLAEVAPCEGCYIHKWIGGDGLDFVIASREQREPSVREKTAIEAAFIARLHESFFSSKNTGDNSQRMSEKGLQKLPPLPSLPAFKPLPSENLSLPTMPSRQ